MEGPRYTPLFEGLADVLMKRQQYERERPLQEARARHETAQAAQLEQETSEMSAFDQAPDTTPTWMQRPDYLTGRPLVKEPEGYRRGDVFDRRTGQSQPHNELGTGIINKLAERFDFLEKTRPRREEFRGKTRVERFYQAEAAHKKEWVGAPKWAHDEVFNDRMKLEGNAFRREKFDADDYHKRMMEDFRQQGLDDAMARHGADIALRERMMNYRETYNPVDVYRDRLGAQIDTGTDSLSRLILQLAARAAEGQANRASKLAGAQIGVVKGMKIKPEAKANLAGGLADGGKLTTKKVPGTLYGENEVPDVQPGAAPQVTAPSIPADVQTNRDAMAKSKFTRLTLGPDGTMKGSRYEGKPTLPGKTLPKPANNTPHPGEDMTTVKPGQDDTKMTAPAEESGKAPKKVKRSKAERDADRKRLDEIMGLLKNRK